MLVLQGGGYLRLKTTSQTTETPPDDECNGGSGGCTDDEEDVHADVDDAAAVQCCLPSNLVLWEYHAVYHISYQVPVLLFSVSLAGAFFVIC
jgi:hypothetical protein